MLGANPAEPTLALDYYHNNSGQVVEVRKDAAANPLEQYLWSPRYVHAPVVRWRDENTDGDLLDQGDTILYYCTDANFNVTALVDTSGAPVERYTYDPYGKVELLDGGWTPREGNASAYSNELLFTGHRLDTESGLYYTLHRHYHPTLGSWVQRDPQGYVDGMGLYEYVGGGPLDAYDPLGLEKGLYPETSTNLGHGFDLMMLTAPDADSQFARGMKYAAEVKAQEMGTGTRLTDIYKEVYGPSQFDDVVKNRYREINPSASTPIQRIRALVVGHGSETVGPYFGRGLDFPENQRKNALLFYPLDIDPGRMVYRTEDDRSAYLMRIIKERLPDTPLGKVKGLISEVVFTNCSIARDKGAAFLDASAKNLHMKFTAPKQAGDIRVNEDGDFVYTPKINAGESLRATAEYLHISIPTAPTAKTGDK